MANDADLSWPRRPSPDDRELQDWTWSETALELPEFGLGVCGLSPEELGDNLCAATGFSQPEAWAMVSLADRFTEHFEQSAHLFSVGCRITVRRSGLRGEPSQGGLSLEALVLALQLLGYSISGTGHVTTWTEPGPRAGHLVSPVLMPRMPEFGERTVDVEGLSKAVDLALKIPRGAFNPSRREDMALHQFAVGAAHEKDADAVIAFMVALKALFVPGLAGETTYRFRLNGARFLGSSTEERRGLYETLGQLYKLRSKLVHGAIATEVELSEGRSKARATAAAGLRRAMNIGWPSGQDFETEALS